jgi:DNA-binding response OmpR family regulator
MNKTGNGGTGIGLALCRELATLMNGEIKVKSRLNYGTSFYLSIPLVEIINSTFIKEDEKIIYQRSSGVNSGGQKLSKSSEIVLLVEDHPDMRRYIKSILEKEYFIVEAEDGKSGFEKALKEIPDLIITDTMMPSMDGHEFSQAIKSDERTSHIPIIMLTAKATLENKLVGLSSGVDSYLTKPFNAIELEASIKALLLERKRLRKLFSKQLLVAPKEFVTNSMDQQFLERVNTVLESQFDDSTFGVPQMQTALVMSKTQLHRKLTAITNQSPGEFLRNFRLQRAAQILTQKGDTGRRWRRGTSRQQRSRFRRGRCRGPASGRRPRSGRRR